MGSSGLGHRRSGIAAGLWGSRGPAQISSHWDESWSFPAAGIFYLSGWFHSRSHWVLLDAIPKGITLILNKPKEGILLFPLFSGAVLSGVSPWDLFISPVPSAALSPSSAVQLWVWLGFRAPLSPWLWGLQRGPVGSGHCETSCLCSRLCNPKHCWNLPVDLCIFITSLS